MFYRHHIFFCTNERPDSEPCCANLSASALHAHAKQRVKALGLDGPGKIRVNKSGCLGRCDLGPCVVVYPEGVWYTVLDAGDVDEIIDSHLVGSRIVERLRLP